MLLATLLRELLTSEQFARVPESDLIMDSGEAVAAFARAGQPNGILSGVYAFFAEQASKMIRPGDRVLDLGCGPALLLSSIAKLNQGSRFIGIDCSAAMIETGNDHLRRSRARNLELRIDDMTELSSVESGRIDVVLSSMAMHHLPDKGHLRRCFEAIERVMTPTARLFVADFGRLKSAKSVEYFVRRAIPRNEPRLEYDYRASLRAAFSREEFAGALSSGMKQRISIYSTVVTPMMIVLMAPFPESDRSAGAAAGGVVEMLPRNRRADYQQLRLSLRLGGMPAK